MLAEGRAYLVPTLARIVSKEAMLIYLRPDAKVIQLMRSYAVRGLPAEEEYDHDIDALRNALSGGEDRQLEERVQGQVGLYRCGHGPLWVPRTKFALFWPKPTDGECPQVYARLSVAGRHDSAPAHLPLENGFASVMLAFALRAVEEAASSPIGLNQSGTQRLIRLLREGRP